jgi:hypothetical protein
MGDANRGMPPEIDGKAWTESPWSVTLEGV